MIRIIVYLAVVFAVASGLAWVADRPGSVSIDWLGWRIETSLLAAVIALFALVVVVLLLWALLRAVLGSPRAFGRFLRHRKRERGQEALSRGLVAVGAGDARLARRYAGEARKALPRDPATRLLEAQSAQLSGDPAAARAIFEAMLEDPDTRTLGLHGLYVEAVRSGEIEAANHFAEEAAKAAPALPWAGRARFEHAAQVRDWDEAIRILDRNAHNGLVDKPAAKRQKAVLLTARALELEDGEPEKARTLALEAHSLAPDFVPAAAAAGRILARLGDTRRASKVVETTWKRMPHPDLADAYAHARHGDAARDRLKRMRTLAALRPGEPEGRLAVARAAIDARDFAAARAELRAVLEARPTQRAILMMADLDEAEHGDDGRMREWLARAVRAPRDPAWTADGIVSEHWEPVSPVSGRLDAFEWKVPVEALGGPTAGPTIDEALFAPPPPPKVVAAPMRPAPEPVPAAAPSPSPAPPAEAPAAAAPAAATETATARPGPAPRPVEFALSHPPDDPGPVDDAPAAAPRARLF